MINFVFKITVLAFTILVSSRIVAAQEQEFTIGLIGDSTVANTYGWGPAFAKRFDQRTSVLNFSKNGATLESLSSKLDELLLQKPDYVLIQFGHNDQKRYDTDVYRSKLESYVKRVTAAGSKAIVLSSVTRRNFGDDGKIEFREEGVKANLTFFAKAAGEVALEQNVTFLDLHSASVAYHNAIGPQASEEYNFNKDDTTHFSPAGAEAITNLVIEELRMSVPEFADYVADSGINE
jgi:pectinesterase